LYFCCE
jgi:hypothetical protein